METDTHTHTHTDTQNDYRNPRCACAPRVNDIDTIGGSAIVSRQWTLLGTCIARDGPDSSYLEVLKA